MKNPVTFSAIPKFAALLLVACDSSTPEIFFESSFPKPHQDLTAVLGEAFQLRQGRDTLRYRLSTAGEAALITRADAPDTLFFGKNCRFRGVYYFNQTRQEGGSYLYAVQIQDNLIYGLPQGQEQRFLVARQGLKGKHKNLVSYMAPDSSLIRLNANKKEVQALFTSVLPQIRPATLVTSHTGGAGLRLQTKKQADPAPAAAPWLLKAYPNPVRDFINLRLRESHQVNYHLTDMKGNTVTAGKARGELLNIDLHHLQAGIYALTLTLTDHPRREQETIKIMKQ
jgi:hypothetical protein